MNNSSYHLLRNYCVLGLPYWLYILHLILTQDSYQAGGNIYLAFERQLLKVTPSHPEPRAYWKYFFMQRTPRDNGDQARVGTDRL